MDADDLAEVDHAGDQHAEHDAQQEEQVDGAVEAQLFFHLVGIMRGLGTAFTAEQDGIQHEVDAQQGQGHEEGLHEQVGGGPEETHALEEAEEQGRIAERSKGAADVGHKEDEEHDLMHAVLAVGVGAQQRTDEEHGGDGGAHPAGQDGAHGQDAGVDHRRAHQRALQAHAAGHGEQGEQQHDEGDVLQQDGMEEFIEGHVETVDRQTGNQEGKAPEDGDLAEVMMPDMRQS